MTPSEPFPARLVAARMIAPAVRELVLERADGKILDYQPGQWVNLVLPLGGEDVKRAYSIASAPAGTPRFELAVTRVSGGAGSHYLHEIAVGETLRAIGPMGLFTRDPKDESPSLLVATGTGVTPLRAMMQAAIGSGSKAPLWLLFGARHEEDVLYREELEAMAKKYPGVRYEITLSQGAPSWTGRRGYVQLHVPELYRALASEHASPHVYICGLERMVKTVRDVARNDLGVDRKHVHQERYD